MSIPPHARLGMCQRSTGDAEELWFQSWMGEGMGKTRIPKEDLASTLLGEREQGVPASVAPSPGGSRSQ